MNANRNPVRILYLGTEPHVTDVAAGFLEQEDDQIAVETAASADTARDCVATNEFDCLVTDHDVLSEYGIEFLRGIGEGQADLPIVVFTGDGTEVLSVDVPFSEPFDTHRACGHEERAKRVVDFVEQTEDTGDAERLAWENDQFRAYRKLADAVPEGMFKLDADGRMVFVNEEWASMVGMDRRDLEGRHLSYLAEQGIVSDQVADEFHALVSDLPARDTKSEDGYFKIQATPPGLDRDAIYEVHVRLLPYEDSFQGCAVVVHDVTERERRGQELETLRERMSFALETTDSLLWAVDLDTGEVTTLLGPAETAFDLDVESIPDVDSLFDTIVHPEDRQAVGNLYELVEHRTSDTLDAKFRTPTASAPDWIEASARVRRGESERLVGLLTDVSERRARKRELEAENDRLGKFAGMVSHDLRNPLDAAKNRLEAAVQNTDQKHLRHVSRAHDWMDAIIDTFLMMAKDEVPSADVESVSISDAAAECWTSVQVPTATLAVDTDETVRAHPTLLQQLFENLFHNALEHGGTNVTVTVDDIEDGFCVADDGAGIPEGERDQAFEAGYSTADGGTGFGLYIVERIATAHGWDVDVTELPDGGTQVEVTGVEVCETRLR